MYGIVHGDQETTDTREGEPGRATGGSPLRGIWIHQRWVDFLGVLVGATGWSPSLIAPSIVSDCRLLKFGLTNRLAKFKQYYYDSCSLASKDNVHVSITLENTLGKIS